MRLNGWIGLMVWIGSFIDLHDGWIETLECSVGR